MHYRFAFCMLICLMVAEAFCKITKDQEKRADASCSFNNLVWSDEFDKLDFSKWQHEITAGGGGNFEFEYYTNNRSNSYVRDSILYIKPTLTADAIGESSLSSNYDLNLWGSTPADMCTGNAFWGCERSAGGGGNIINPIQSARIRTVNSFSFTYGRLEIKAKLPKGDWLWPAIWLLPTHNPYGAWPASGEIDLVESKGNTGEDGVNSFGSTLHWGPFWPNDPYQLTHASYKLPSGDFSDDFHVFGLIWCNTSISTYLDTPSNVILNVPITKSFWELGGWDKTNHDNPWAAGGIDAPFDQSFYMVLNVAVGGVGGYFPDSMAGKPWKNTDAHAMNNFWDAVNSWYPTWKGESAALQVDWIRVYQ